jgi:hypothetical protein
LRGNSRKKTSWKDVDEKDEYDKDDNENNVVDSEKRTEEYTERLLRNRARRDIFGSLCQMARKKSSCQSQWQSKTTLIPTHKLILLCCHGV